MASASARQPLWVRTALAWWAWPRSPPPDHPTDGAAQPLEMLDHACHQPVGAAARKPHAAILFQLVDQRVDRTGRHRVAADEQCVKAQRLPQIVALYIFADDGIDAAPRLIFGKRRGGLDHRGEIEKRHMAQFLIAFVIDARRIVQKLGIARDIRRIELGNFRRERGIIIRIVEDGAIRPVQAVKGHDRVQRHICRHVVPGQAP
jgi:hypothetical protein